MRKFEAFLTNNGNIAVIVKEVSDRGESDIQYCAFITPKGEWLRECTYEEVTNVAFNNRLPLADLQPVRDFLKAVMPEHAPTWEFMGSIRVEEDFSSYKPETCNNGGDYAFYTSLDIYFTTINGKAVIRGVTRYGTSAEFEFDELNGSFQTNLTGCQVLNTHYQYKIGNDVFSSIRSYSSTQGYETTFLEQISQVYKLEDINNLTCKVIERDDDNEIQEREYIPEVVDDVVAKLITAGAAFAPVKKSRRS